MPLKAGTSLGRYVIESPLGAGGMGDVYLAEDTGLHRRVALTAADAAFAIGLLVAAVIFVFRSRP